MKVYYLKLTQDDFTSDGNVWTSDVVDLYDNDSYRNYSTTKSDYGLNTLGNKTWTGLQQNGSDTDSGFIDSGRFIDTTGRIDIFRWSVETSNLPGNAIVNPVLAVYTSDDETETDLDEWSSRTDILEGEAIGAIDAYRYAKFVLRFDSLQDLTGINFDFYVRVTIEIPVMDPLYSRTKEVLKKFPEWMSLRENDILDVATPQLATPTSLGSQLINAVAGEWLNDIDKDIDYIRLQQYINTADLSQTAWIYRADGVPKIFIHVTGDGTELARTASLEEFYELTDDEDGFWWDENQRTIYTNKEYTSLLIDDVEYPQTLQQVWNWFDEHGAIVDIYRHRGEDNDTFRKRILDVYVNRPGVGMEAFKLALRRELNLWLAFDNATPDSEYVGATPVVLEMEDIEDSSEFVDYDGMPKDKFIALVEELAELYPTTWGYFKWGQARWDMGGPEHEGFGLLPYRYDATPLDPSDTQSGVGDGNDLYVFRPDAITGPREFNAQLKVRGRERSVREEYPPLTFTVELYGTADKEIFDNPTLEPWVTVGVNTATETYYLSRQLTVKSDVDNNNPSPTENSWVTFEYMSEGTAIQDFIWYDTTGEAYEGNAATPFVLEIADTVDVDAYWGRFDPDTQTFTDFPADNSLTLWFEDDDLTTLDANGIETTITFTQGATPVDPPAIVVQSNETSSSVERWESDRQEVTLTINGALPDNGVQDVTIDTPNILWDPDLESPANKEYVVTYATVSSDGTTLIAEGALPNGELEEYPHTMIYVNGDNSWVSGELTFDADTTTELTFSSGTNADPAYPIDNYVWTLFEAVQTSTVYGVVDENGPWRNGIPHGPGNNNFALEQITVDRDDFGIPHDEDHVITWMGVDVIDNNRVIAWLDSNSVNPVHDIDNSLVYPDNAITEIYDDGTSTYSYSPFILRARIRPGIDPEWNPQVHSGWFYDRQKEYYFYAEPKDETLAATPVHELSEVARQGAPIILKTDEATPVEYRQVAFIDDATPTLTLTNKEVVYGTGTNKVFVAYDNLFDISVVNLSTNEDITDDVTSTTNEITVSSNTSKDIEYEVTYTLENSFIADHEFIDSNNENKTKITIAQSNSFSTPYTISYEGSTYDPATPVDLPLNSFYTTIDEGFIFISHDEYDPAVVEVRLSPTKLVADGKDYLLLSVRVLDLYGNPKPNQTFSLTTTFGTFDNGLDAHSLLTDRDGFATTLLTAENTTATNLGYVYVDGPNDVDATVNFFIDPVKPKPYRLVALPSPDQMPADGESQVVIYGRVEDPDHAPVPYAAVAWKKGRNICDMFSSDYEGQVVADDQGFFSIGPLTAATPDEPGYWFVGAESWFEAASPATPGDQATPDYDLFDYETPQYGPVGDVVFWNEYPDSKFGVNNANELPKQAVQMQTNPWDTVYYSSQNGFPVTYDEATPLDDATPVSVDCPTPKWYAIDKYTQYQLGFLGTGFYSVDFDPDVHPDYKDL